ncbi:hypothetical protein JL100_014910 [Skermanella mucosa]|uniref:hypothetical protein n=1 Tax=Skermanella mucosa TaxID=1789672 RepID=UPI00192B7300|nr:hypothetical protein [Skermanella mucosa]UEM18421.1 hypothetical protein JL100_014910 [Skermanella mucosa]
MRLAAVALVMMLATGPAAGAGPCEPVTLVDEATGRSVVGAEDIALDQDSGRLVVSAHDRLAGADPGGGLYGLDLGHLATGGVRVRDLADGTVRRPHGIDLYEGKTLFVVDRGDGEIGSTAVWIIDLAGGGRRRVENPLLCRANDIAALDSTRFLFTADHGACGRIGVAVENILGLARGFVGYFDGETVRAVASGLDFPNGIAVNRRRDEVVVAATRGRELLVYGQAELLAGAPARRRLPLDGAPDNLSVTDDGRILVALHPALWRLALHRYGLPGGEHAPSRIESLDMAGGARRVFEDDGTRLSAATVAVAWRDRLLIGSVLGDHLWLCR